MFTTLLTTQLVFGQERVSTKETYVKKDIPKPFIVRWIKNLFGPSFGQIARLELRTDGTFHYSYNDLYCGTFDVEGNGIWIKEDDRLILKPNDQYLLVGTKWIMHKRKLYASLDSLNNGIWAMKRK